MLYFGGVFTNQFGGGMSLIFIGNGAYLGPKEDTNKSLSCQNLSLFFLMFRFFSPDKPLKLAFSLTSLVFIRICDKWHIFLSGGSNEMRNDLVSSSSDNTQYDCPHQTNTSCVWVTDDSKDRLRWNMPYSMGIIVRNEKRGNYVTTAFNQNTEAIGIVLKKNYILYVYTISLLISTYSGGLLQT